MTTMATVMTVLDIPDMTSELYQLVKQNLERMGQMRPHGRLYHVASAQKFGGWRLVDVWESPQRFHQFAGALMPILIKHGMNPPAPQITAVCDMCE